MFERRTALLTVVVLCISALVTVPLVARTAQRQPTWVMDKDRDGLAGMSGAETERRHAEFNRTLWESFRKDIEKAHADGRLDRALYVTLMSSYQAGIDHYRAGIDSYRLFTKAHVSESAVGVEIDRDSLFASSTSLAGAQVKLARARSQSLTSFAERARESTLNSFPPSDALEPIRAYVRDEFPRPAEGDTLDSYFDKADAFAQEIARSAGQPFARLLVTSTPEGARVRLRPKYATTAREETTEANFPHLAIGRYHISIQLPGYTPYEGDLDWLNNTQPVLLCSLGRDGAPTTCTRKGQE